MSVNTIQLSSSMLMRERLKSHITISFVRIVLPEYGWLEDVEIYNHQSLGGAGELAEMLASGRLGYPLLTSLLMTPAAREIKI